MILPLLEQLSARHTSFRTTPRQYQIPASPGNSVIKEARSFLDVHMLSQLKATHLDLTDQPLSIEQLEAFGSFRLELFKFKSTIINIAEYLRGQEHMNPIDCFCHCWRLSHQSLTNLSVPNFENLQKDWLNTLLKNFTHVSSLNLSNTLYTSFPSLTGSFSHLRCLDISDTFMPDLRGISNFPNLIILHIRNLGFVTAMDIEEISKLTKLRILDVSQKLPEGRQGENANDFAQQNNIVQLLVQKEICLPDLRFLNCSNTRIDNHCLNMLLKLNRNLFYVVLYRTSIADAVRVGITLASTIDLERAVDLLKFHSNNDPNQYSRHILKDIHKFLEAGIPFDAHEPTLQKCLDVLLKKVESLAKETHDVREENLWTMKCILLCCQLYAKSFGPTRMQQVVMVMMRNRNSWCILGNPNITHIPGLDMAFFYEQVIDYFLRFEAYNMKDNVLTMVDALINLHSLIPVEIRSEIGNERQCILMLCVVLDTWCPVHVNNVEFFLISCRRVQAAIETLVNGSRDVIDVTTIVNIINITDPRGNPVIQEILLTSLKDMLFRVDSELMATLASLVDIRKMLSFLLVDMESSYENTDLLICLDLAYAATNLLALLLNYVDREEIDLDDLLLNLPDDLSYYELHIAQTIIAFGEENRGFVQFFDEDARRGAVIDELTFQTEITNLQITNAFRDNMVADGNHAVVNIRGETLTGVQVFVFLEVRAESSDSEDPFDSDVWSDTEEIADSLEHFDLADE